MKSNCDRDRLRLLLADNLPEAAQSEIAEHVSRCAACRESLESLAGDTRWWAEVQACFSDHAATFRYPSTETPPALENVNDFNADFISDFASDFAVDFLTPCDRPETIGRLGDYEIQEVVSRGGMGVVLKGYQRELGRYVAVKVMAPHLAASGAARARFIREARAAAAIVHPNVMPIHSVCTSARLPYLAMPFVDCESLQQRIDREGPLKLEEILRIGFQAASGLAAAHAQGLVHRDVKPANILLERGVDRAVLTDFGLARAADDGSLTRTGVVAGTPRYMSPEQAQGEPVDARSDLFSLGSVLYAMAAGRPPFRAETALGILRRICDSEPRPICEVNVEIPEWFARIVERLHKKAPGDRLQTAGEVAALLEQCLAHVQQPATAPLPENLRGEVRKRSLFRRRSVAAMSGVVACGAVVATLAAIGAWRTIQAPEEAARGPAVPRESPALETLSDAAVTREANAFRDDLERLEERSQGFFEQHRTFILNEEPLP